MAFPFFVLFIPAMLYGVDSFDPMTATLKRTFDVPIPDNGTTDLTIKGLLVTNNNKLVIAQEEVVGYGSKTKVMVVSLDNVDEIKEIDMGASEEFADMTLLSDGLVAIALMYDEKILLVDVSGAEPVTSASLTPSREYAQFGVAAGTGDELIIAGWTTDYVGHVDVMSRQGDVISNIIRRWYKVLPEHVMRNGSELYVTGTDLEDYRPLFRVEIDTGLSITNIGTLDLTELDSKTTFYQGDADSAGNLYFPVEGPPCYDGNDEAPSAHYCVLVIAPDGRVRVLLYGVDYGTMATAVAVTETGDPSK